MTTAGIPVRFGRGDEPVLHPLFEAYPRQTGRNPLMLFRDRRCRDNRRMRRRQCRRLRPAARGGDDMLAQARPLIDKVLPRVTADWEHGLPRPFAQPACPPGPLGRGHLAGHGSTQRETAPSGASIIAKAAVLARHRLVTTPHPRRVTTVAAKGISTKLDCSFLILITDNLVFAVRSDVPSPSGIPAKVVTLEETLSTI